MGELPIFEVMTWQLCHLLRFALNCFQVTLRPAKVRCFFEIRTIMINFTEYSDKSVSLDLMEWMKRSFEE